MRLSETQPLPAIQLPMPANDRDMSVFAALEQRKTTREICATPLPLLDLNQQQKKIYTKLCRQLSQTRRRVPLRHKCKHPDGGDAHKPVLFQVALSTLHIDILEGRKHRADPITRR